MLVVLAFLSIPMFSTVLLLLAGILIGYAICYPFRTDSDEIAYELQEVRRQNESLQDTLHGQRQAYARLDAKYSEQHREWTNLRESHHKLESAWRDFGKDQERLGDSLEDLRRTSREANEMARREKAERSALEKKLVNAEDTIHKLHEKVRISDQELLTLKDSDGELVTALRTELREAREQLTQQQTEMEELAALRTEATHRKGEERESNLLLRKKLDEARHTVDKQRKQLESFSQQSENTIKLEAELVAGREIIAAVRDDLAATRAELHNAQSKSTQWSTNHDELLKQQAVAKSITAELHETRRELESVRSQISQVEADRDDAVAAHLEATEQSKNLLHRINQSEEQLERAHNQRANLVTELRQQQRENAELQEKITEYQTEIKTMSATTAQLNNLESERNQLISTLGKRREQLRLAEAEKNETVASNRKLTAKIEQLLAESRQRSEQIDKIRGQREEVLARLRREEARRKQLQRTLEEAEEEMIELRKQLQRLQVSDNKQQAMQESLTDARERLQQLTLERDAAFSAEASVREEEAKRTRKLQEGFEAQVRRISELESDRDQLRDRLARQNDTLQSHEAQLQKTVMNHDAAAANLGQAEKTIDELRKVLDTKEETIDWLQREMDDLKAKLIRLERDRGGNTRRDKRRGVIYIKPPKTKDDLKEIAGVASVLESKLNDFGIYKYEQIMEWDEMAVAEFSKLLAFRDRIEREHWIDQARKLFNQKYGSRAA